MINKLQLDDFELSYTSEGEGRDVLFYMDFLLICSFGMT